MKRGVAEKTIVRGAEEREARATWSNRSGAGLALPDRYLGGGYG